MRALVVEAGPHYSVADVAAGWTEALGQLGVQVAVFNTGSRLVAYTETLFATGERGPHGELALRKGYTSEAAAALALSGILAACYTVWPDVVIFVSGFFLQAELVELIRARGHTTVLICTEQPYEHARELALAEHMDLALLNDPVKLDAFAEVTRAAYVPHSYRPSLHHPTGRAAMRDLVFVGTGYPSRRAFFEAMDTGGLDVLLAGNWQDVPDDSPLRIHLANASGECVENTATADLYASSRLGINLYRREADRPGDERGWAMGPREVEMAACGLAFLREPRAEGDQVLHMLPTFTDPAEAGDLARWWLAHPTERERAARTARAAIADRTFTNRAAELLCTLDSQPVRT